MDAVSALLYHRSRGYSWSLWHGFYWARLETKMNNCANSRACKILKADKSRSQYRPVILQSSRLWSELYSDGCTFPTDSHHVSAFRPCRSRLHQLRAINQVKSDPFKSQLGFTQKSMGQAPELLAPEPPGSAVGCHTKDGNFLVLWREQVDTDLTDLFLVDYGRSYSCTRKPDWRVGIFDGIQPFGLSAKYQESLVRNFKAFIFVKHTHLRAI